MSEFTNGIKVCGLHHDREVEYPSSISFQQVLITYDAGGSTLAAGPAPADRVLSITFDLDYAPFADMHEHPTSTGAE
jgi:hypothetical protein